MKNSNPLLTKTTLPLFKQIQPKHVKPAITAILKENRANLKKLLANKAGFTWENLMFPLEEIHENLSFAWSTVNHLNSVMNSQELRKAYEQTLPLVSEYYTELGQNTDLYNAINSLTEKKYFSTLDKAQQKILHDELRDFRLAGVALPTKDKKQFMQLSQKLANLGNKFSNNVLDATQNWEILLKQDEIAGIPENALIQAAARAQAKKQTGWLFTLDFPSYQAVITYADSRKIREQIYTASITRASEVGPNAGKYDNTKIMHEIMCIRKKLAQKLDFNNYAEYSLATKMASSPQQVMQFLQNLAKKSLPQGKNEFKALSKFAAEKLKIKKIEPWDIAYCSEKLRQQKFAISQEELRPYFPDNHVLQGLFLIAQRLFGIKVKATPNKNIWHKDVKFFSIFDSKNKLRGQIYIDLYARPNKRSGAWMDECKGRRHLADGSIQIPVAYLTCNFNQPIGKNPALLTHAEVDTLFHEFGHCLQHLLTTVDYAAAAGIRGIPWDAVELASQIMENWCWEPQAIKLLSKHYKSHKTLPKEMLQRLSNSKKFQAAMAMLRQLEFAIFDFQFHLKFNPKDKKQLQKTLDSVHQKISVMPITKNNRMANSFLHIFANSYAAGYYSYKWAEVLAADAFAKFIETGIFNRKTGKEFLQCFLEPGGTVAPMELFKKFRGRAPKVDALLQHSGIIRTK